MPPIWLILTFVAIVLYDANTYTPTIDSLTTLQAILLTLGPMLVITLISAARVLQLGAAIFRAQPDAPRKAMSAERWSGLGRTAPAAWLIASIYLFGWLDAVRATVGNLIVIDELLAALPVIVAATASWAAYYPISRRLREIALNTALFTGKPAPPQPTLAEYITDQFRNRVALGLIILTTLLAWRESVDLFLAAAHARSTSDPTDQQPAVTSLELAQPLLHLVGVAIILLLSPLAARLAWNTRPLPPGELRDNLLSMCAKHNVSIRNILVWRTHGTILNAAVMGLLPQLRYVLLTDALIDELTQDRLEAVMAHELGHVRCRHMPWLIASLIAAITAATIAFTIPAEYAIHIADLPQAAANAASISATALGLAAGFLAFGYISRRFEWQADAFGAKHGSSPTAAAMQQHTDAIFRTHFVLQDDGADDADTNSERAATVRERSEQSINSEPTNSERAATVRERSEQPTASIQPTTPINPSGYRHYAQGMTTQRTNTRSTTTPPVITHQGAEAMAGALSDVARYNHAETHRFGFLHGSIHARQTKLRKLPGKHTDRLPIDRTVRRIKLAVAITFLAVIALTIWDVRNTINHNNHVLELQQLREQQRQEAIDQLRMTGEAAISGFADGFRKPRPSQQPQQPTQPNQEQTP